MDEKKRTDAPSAEDGIRITAQSVTTPEGEFALADIVGASARTSKPVWGPVLLAALGTLNLAAAVQTSFWVDWLASTAMLGGGLYWRFAATRYVLVLETAEKKIDAWYVRSSGQRDRALAAIHDALV